ncbi:Transcription factor GTE9 [Linum perenne]
MVKSGISRGAYNRSSFGAAGEFEGSASSGQIDMDVTASGNPAAPIWKFSNLNSSKWYAFSVPTEVLPLAQMSSSERRDLVRRLRLELQQIQAFQKEVVVERGSVNVSSSSRIQNDTNRPNSLGRSSKKTSIDSSGLWKKSAMHKQKADTLKRPAAPNTGNTLLLKQFEALLKLLMSHRYGYVFNTPVDVVKLNIPDYFTVIKEPMDLGTVKSRMALSMYTSPQQFAEDVRLTFRNAMLYNPKGNDVHFMAETLSKFFEAKWKGIEIKLPKTGAKYQPENSAFHGDFDTAQIPSKKKRKLSPSKHGVVEEPVQLVMTSEEKHKLGLELESLLSEMPLHIIDFLREHSSNGQDAGQDEIEIDIDDLSEDTLFTLRELLDKHSKEKQENKSGANPCEIELLNESRPSYSSMQQHKVIGQADEDVDIGGNEPLVSSYPHVEIESDIGPESNKVMSSGSSQDTAGSSDVESEHVKPSHSLDLPKVPVELTVGGQPDEKTISDHPLDRNQSFSGLDQLEENSHQKLGSDESDCQQDGESAHSDSQVSSHKNYRAAIIRNRFSDMILKAREEKTLLQVDMVDPEKLQVEKEKLELQKKKEKARLQAEAKAAEDARKQAEAAAAAEARQEREVEREAARQALLKIERSVEINENSKFLEDLEMLRNVPAEQLPSSVDESSPEQCPDGLGGFKFAGDGNPLEQLGLFRKDDEEEEEVEPLNAVRHTNDAEEGEIEQAREAEK